MQNSHYQRTELWEDNCKQKGKEYAHRMGLMQASRCGMQREEEEGAEGGGRAQESTWMRNPEVKAHLKCWREQL